MSKREVYIDEFKGFERKRKGEKSFDDWVIDEARRKRMAILRLQRQTETLDDFSGEIRAIADEIGQITPEEFMKDLEAIE